jgi:hypothetical protein
MAHVFPFWLGRFLFPARLLVRMPAEERAPLKIEVEHLPDYQWRELGFPRPARIRRE